MTEFSGTAPLYLVPTSPEFDYRRKDLPNSVRYVGACFERRHAPSRNTPQTVSPESARVLVDSGLPYARPDFAERAVAEISALGLAHEKGNAYTLTSSLRSASVVVSNANSPMVLAALDHGVPIVAIPDSLESAENGWRIRDFGCGIRLSPNRLREGRIREAVSTILRVGSYRDKACELAASFSAHGGPVQASKLLVELALSHRWQSKSA